jgi:6-phospho-3-hexuloisomerase
MKYITYEKKILEEIKNVLKKNPESNEEEIVKDINSSKNIFITGAGRSGLIGKTFAMRLMQIGKKVFVVGETITPAITKNDLLISICGSGKTKTTIDICKEAKETNAKIITITSNKKSQLTKISDFVILLEAKTKDTGKSIQPLGSLFEQSAFIFLDAVIIGLMKKTKTTEKKMRKKHASLE